MTLCFLLMLVLIATYTNNVLLVSVFSIDYAPDNPDEILCSSGKFLEKERGLGDWAKKKNLVEAMK